MTFWQRFKTCWRLLWTPGSLDDLLVRVTYPGLEILLREPVSKAALYAVEKVSKDPSFHPTKDHDKKHAEALQWAVAWMRQNTPKKWPSTWALSLLVEWHLGVKKGRLP